MTLEPVVVKAGGRPTAIFCRGCDCGRSAKGAFSDLDSRVKSVRVEVVAGIDIYCAECVAAMTKAAA